MQGLVKSVRMNVSSSRSLAMRLRYRSLAILLVLSALIPASFVAYARDKKSKPAKTVAAVSQIDQSKRVLHALNRLTFGPRPGDMQRVTAMGVDKWIEQQLHPEKIDDGALEARLAPYRTLKMDTQEIVKNFPPPQLLKAAAEGKIPLPSDPQERAIYQAAIERYQQKKNVAQNDTANADNGNGNGRDTGKRGRKMDPETRMYAEMKAQELLDMEPEQRMQAMLKMPPDELAAMARSMNEQERQRFTAGLTPKDRETLMALAAPQRVVETELIQGKLLRAIYSERQLDEIMTDFWMNHFNVFIGKGVDRYMLTSYERDVIRPHALGKFKDLLVATAKSPAMLFYLDNWMSIGPTSDAAKNVGRREARRNESRPRMRGGFGGAFAAPARGPRM